MTALLVERHGDVVVWTLDRPETKNALDAQAMIALGEAIDAAGKSDARAAVLTGANGVFVSGGDLRELRERGTPEDAARLTDMGFHLCHALGELPFPVIAALSGPAIGGGAELALACDLRVAAPHARIAFKQARMGVTTAWGSVERLVSLVGHGTAMRLLVTAAEIGAEEARSVGLVDAVGDDALAVALAWAADVAKGAPRSVASLKRLVRDAAALPPAIREREREAFIAAWTGPDRREAVEAWFERRAPRFLPR